MPRGKSQYRKSGYYHKSSYIKNDIIDNSLQLLDLTKLDASDKRRVRLLATKIATNCLRGTKTRTNIEDENREKIIVYIINSISKSRNFKNITIQGYIPKPPIRPKPPVQPKPVRTAQRRISNRRVKD